MPQIRKYAPLIGSGILVAGVVLRLFGQAGAADAVEAVGGAVGLTTQSPVSGTELASAAAALAGIVAKIVAEVKKAKAS